MPDFRKMFIWIVSSWLILALGASAIPSTPTPLRNVGLSLIRLADGTPVAMPPSGATLSVEARPTKPDEDIGAALRANGILPDDNAYRIVYDLNSDVSDLKAGELPATLNLPKVVIREGKLDRNSYLIRLSVDEELRQQLVAAIARLEQQTAEFPQDVEATDLQREAMRSLQATTRILSVVKRSLEQGSQPVGKALLLQLKEGTEAVADLLAEVSGSNRAFTPSDMELLKAVEEDVDIKASTFDEVRAAGEPPKKWREVKVRVRVFKPKSGREARQLRIFYTALRNRTRYPFTRLTPDAVEKIPEGRYYFWAAFDGNPEAATPHVGPLKIRVQEGNEQVVDLTMIR